MPTQYLPTPEGPIAYEEAGSGPVVICVPGLGDLRQEYRLLAPALVAAGYRVVTMDLRGHGESGVRFSDYSVQAVGADILALARHLAAGPVTVVGTSMAAGAALCGAAQDPQAIGKLVLIGAAVRDGGPLWLSRLISLLFAGPWGARLWTTFYDTLYPSVKPGDLLDYRRMLRRNLSEPGRLRAMRRMIAASKAASEEAIARVQAPTLLVMGTKDPDFPDPAAEATMLAGRLRGEARMVEGAGHYPHVEMPEVTLPLIVEFVGRTEVARA